MRKFTLASLLLTTILLTSFSFAQTCDSTCCEQPQNQIQFHLVNDYSVSYLKMLTPTSGLRFKIDLGLGGSTGDGDGTNKNYYTSNQFPITSTEERKEENSSSSQYVNLVVNYSLFCKLKEDVNCFVCAGPLLSYSRSHSESTADQKTINPSQTYFSKTKSERTNSFIGAGLQLALGMEVSITQKLSFLAEFNLNGTYSWNKYTYSTDYQSPTPNRNEHIENGNSWNYGLNRLKLGIAYSF